MADNLSVMKRQFACLALFALIATAAGAQNAPEPPGQIVPDPPGPTVPSPNGPEATDPHEGLLRPPDELPKPGGGDRNRNIEFLFGALKAAPDEASAKSVEDRIWAVWTNSGNETTTFLMGRAKKATDDKDYDLALKMLNAIIEIKPDYIEAWNRRATIYFLKHDYSDSLADIGKVLTREPRHFGALSGLARIMEDIGDDKRALDAYRKEQEVYPRLKGLQEKVKALTEKVEGRNI
jgi:tetratricopeptide (TPR) repeat protein